MVFKRWIMQRSKTIVKKEMPNGVARKHKKDVCGAIVAASPKYSIAHVCRTLVYIVRENQLCINGERCSIMSESG